VEENKEVNKSVFDREKIEKSVWFMWVTLILFAPYGAYLMWVNKRYNVIARVVLTIVFLLWYFFIVGYTKNLKG
jgi:hypothetical protein